MRDQDRSTARTWIALVTTLSLVFTPAAPIVAAQTEEPAAPEPSEDVDGGWPRDYTTPSGGEIILYQPQIASWTDQKHMVGFSAVSHKAPSADNVELGTIKLQSDTKVALEQRLVSFHELEITEVNFPTLSREQTREVVKEIEDSLTEGERVIALDRILANIDKSHIVPRNVEGVKADPPKIYFNTKPAILVGFDGDPIWSPIQGNDLEFAVNTNWDVFRHGPTSTFYLRHEALWLATSDLEGSWRLAGELPESFAKLPDDDNWKEVKANLPGKKSDMPIVFLSFAPAELILLEGEPKYEPVAGTSLLWVSNTDSDLFRMGKDGPVYYLVAGRWFSAESFNGPWTFASTSLPEDFEKIPIEHERSRVLASVPGSDEAINAVLLADVPKTARVNVKQVQAPEVTYQGDPEFAKIDDTSLERAVNTDKDIIKIGDLYYMCFQAVWFMSKTPEGPWEVATSVPKDIYDIPASSPSHHVTYVTVVEEEKDDDGWVTFAYVAGYTGLMIAWGCAVWGTGWYYPPYYWYGGFYPGYYPYARTYGMSAWYNPWTGAYGRGARVYGPYGGAGFGAAYNPRTGTYARGAAAYGPYGSRSGAQAWNPRTGTYAQTRQGRNVYGSWGSTHVQRGDDWAQTVRTTNRATGTTRRATRTDDGAAISRRGPGGSGFVAGNEGGDLYAGRDGNVYKREDGSWQKHDGGGDWSQVDPPERASQRADQAHERSSQARSGVNAPSGTRTQLQRDYAARSSGAQRSSAYGNYRSSGGRAGYGGSFRGGRGGRGGRRR